jgi:hypothetical protein
VVTNNTITGSPQTGFLADSQVGIIGLGLHNNVSTGTALAYDLNTNAAGQINLERDANGAFPPFTASTGTNQGVPVSLSGNIVPVSFGSVMP